MKENKKGVSVNLFLLRLFFVAYVKWLYISDIRRQAFMNKIIKVLNRVAYGDRNFHNVKKGIILHVK